MRVSRRALILLCVLAGTIALGWIAWRRSGAVSHRAGSNGVMVEKQGENFASRTFDPANPPADMPPMSPGEAAVCDSNFTSVVNVSGDMRDTDSTHETVRINQIRVTLGLEITIWLPAGAAQHMIEHEDGHRQISEFYYREAGNIVQRIAAGYIGKQEAVSGADLNGQADAWLQQMGKDISDEYNRELNPDPTQQRYDLITDYSRNGVAAADAVGQVLKDVTGAPATNTGN
jgi:hypothetical protein